MAERGALSLLTLLCLTLVSTENTAAKHVDKGKGCFHVVLSLLSFDHLHIFSHLAWKNLAHTNQGLGGLACKEQLLTLRNGARRLTDNPPGPIFHNFKSRLRCRNWHNIYTRSSRDRCVKQHAFTHLPFVLVERGLPRCPLFSPARRAPRLRADCLHCAHFWDIFSPSF